MKTVGDLIRELEALNMPDAPVFGLCEDGKACEDVRAMRFDSFDPLEGYYEVEARG